MPPRRDLANDLLSSQSSSEGTVDTRYSAGVKRAELPEMWEILYREPIDLLYLDTTYWDCEIDHFPSREEAKAKILRVCQQHNEDLIIIAVRRLGKEEILVQGNQSQFRLTLN